MDSDMSRASMDLRVPVLSLFLGVLVLVVGCGGGDPAEPEAATLTISINPTSGTVAQGGSTDLTFSATAGGSFTGTASVTITGLPTGVTGTESNVQTAGNTTTGTVTVDVAAAVALGTYNITVTASGSGVSASATYALTVVAAPAYTISPSTDPLLIDQGDAGGSLITLARTNFTEDVTLSLEALPVGVGFAFDPSPTSGDMVALTVEVDGAVDVGDYTLIVRGTSASLADVTATFVLSVNVPGGFGFSGIDDLTVAPNGTASRDVTWIRTGTFTGDVTVSVSDLPAGLIASVNPTTTAGTMTTIEFTAAAGIAVGAYPLTIVGTADGEPDVFAAMTVNVSTGPPGQSLFVDFSTCGIADRPVWFAYSDDMGNWTAVTGVGDVYSITVPDVFGIAAVTSPGPGEYAVLTQYLTVADATAGNFELCAPDPATFKTVNGTVTNTVGLTYLTLGGATTSAFADGPFTIGEVESGSLNFIGYSRHLTTSADRMLILRGQDIADGGNIGTIDFTADGFDPPSATITVNGLVGGETEFGGMSYSTPTSGGMCTIAPLTFEVITSPFQGRGALIAEQEPGDLHIATVNASTSSGTRSVRETFGFLQDRTLELGAAMPAPTITNVSGTANYLRLQADFLLPADYDVSSLFLYSIAGRSVLLLATDAARSGDVSYALPDFSGLAGWMDMYAPPTSSTSVSWATSGSGANSVYPSCTEGGRFVSAGQTGTYN